jgi:DNA-binding LacI/PurR family transcriptional regulator
LSCSVKQKMKRFNWWLMPARIKLSDVAKTAGVSLGTASNAFNRPELVRPEVREQVDAAARLLGYSGPDPKGRLLMGGKANAIGVLPAGDMPVSVSISSPYLRAMVLGIAEVCDEHNASLVLLSGIGEQKTHAIRNALVDGFILGQASEVELVSARQRRVPFVMMDMEAGPEIGSVRIDGASGARLQIEHLLGLGHRKFAITSTRRTRGDAIFHPPGGDRSLDAGYALDREKLSAYAVTLAAAGLSIDDMPIIEVFPPAPFHEAGARELLDRAPGATAIVCMADRTAIAVVEEAGRRGIDVPRQLSVIGFDNVSDSPLTTPPLSTIAQPIVEKGRLAARMLFEGGPARHEILPVELVLRGSTGRVPGRRHTAKSA